MIKKCISCGNEKDSCSFSVRSDNNKLNNKCDECKKEYLKIYRRNNKNKTNKNNIQQKKCSVCKCILHTIEFSFDPTTKDGYSYTCKKCYSDYIKNNTYITRRKSNKYNNKNKEKISKRNKSDREYFKIINNNLDPYLYAKTNRCCDCKKILPAINFYRDAGRKNGLSIMCKDCQRKRQLIYERKKINNDKIYKLKKRIRTRLYAVVKKYANGNKKISAVKDLGCTFEIFIKYIESMFYQRAHDGERMSWDNYGEWHLDHIKPLSLFNLNDIQELLDACHYTNLQPMWAKENIKKSNNFKPKES